MATGIFTLTAMSVDRYMSIQHPSHAHWSSAPSSAVVLTVITWATSSVFMAPQLYVRTIDTLSLPDLPAMTFCIEDWPEEHDRQIFSFLLLLLVYVIPVLIVAVCYANVGKMLCTLSFRREGSSSDVFVYSRRRAARILILLVGLFICCWLPYNVMSLIIDIQELSSLMPFLPFALWFGHAHSAVNPFLYWVTNRQFREMVAKLHRRMRCPFTKNKRRPVRVLREY